jgi:hypothetical protein
VTVPTVDAVLTGLADGVLAFLGWDPESGDPTVERISIDTKETLPVRAY